MWLMRVDGDICVEVVEVPDVARDLVTPSCEAVVDPATGEIIIPAVEAVYRERPAVAADFFHAGSGFVVWDGAAAIGQVRQGRLWVDQPPVAAPAVRQATPHALVTALTASEFEAMQAARPRDMARIIARAGDMIPQSNPPLGRLAAAAGVSPDAWIERCLAA